MSKIVPHLFVVAGALVVTFASAHAEPHARLGKLVALSVMAKACNLTITPEQNESVNAIGPKLQQETGLSDAQMSELLKSMLEDFNTTDCTDVAKHWADSVPALIEQAKADP